MSDISRPPRLFISVAEQSADEHAAGLIRAFRTRHPNAEFVGLAGPRMREAGCRALDDLTTRASMLLGVASRVPTALRTIRRVDHFLGHEPIDAAVLIDSGTLHLPLARRCRAHGVPVFYFIAPQTWASRPWRNRALRERVDRLAVILPFEEEFFRRNGIAAEYVGHPLFDRLAAEPPDPERVRALRGDASPVVAIFPGSRRQVVRENLPAQLDIAEAVAGRFKRARFLLAVANDAVGREVRATIAARTRTPPIALHETRRGEVLAAADLALAASGTVTLEAAYYHTPMIVMYNAAGARWFYKFVRGWLIQASYLSLPNILAGRAIVPEFMPYYRNPTEIATLAIEMLSSPGLLERMRQDLAAVMQPIVRLGACDRAAAGLETLLAERVGRPRRGVTGSRHAVW